jgi:hypothetical protein
VPLAVFPALAFVVGPGFMPMLLIPPLMLVSSMLFPGPELPPGPSDSDDGGGGSGRDGPPDPPKSPRGGIPLPDAEPARFRLRGHERPRRLSRPRRAATEPARSPLRTRRGP